MWLERATLICICLNFNCKTGLEVYKMDSAGHADRLSTSQVAGQRGWTSFHTFDNMASANTAMPDRTARHDR